MLYFIELSSLDSLPTDSTTYYLEDEVNKVKQLMSFHKWRSYIQSEASAELMSKVLGVNIEVYTEPLDIDSILKEPATFVLFSAKKKENIILIHFFIVKSKNKVVML